MFEMFALQVVDSQSKYLVNAVSLHSKLPSKAFGGIRLGAVLRQLALVVMTHSGLSRHTKTDTEKLKKGTHRKRHIRLICL